MEEEGKLGKEGRKKRRRGGREERKFNISSKQKKHTLKLQLVAFFFFFFFFVFLGPQLRHMDVPRLGVESELQLLAYVTATAVWDLSHVCGLHYSSWQRQILNPQSRARDQICILMDTSWGRYC